MRGKKAAINTLMNLLEEAIAVVCGFILPRLILSAFGSRYNGLTQSITQFLQCAILLRSGIGGATRAALYKPLADGDKPKFDAIVKATDLFMKRIGMILAGLIVVFAAIYPFFVRTEFDWFFTFSLFLIIGMSTFAESFFGITYLIVLQADQRLWVSALLKSVCVILNTVIAAILIHCGATIHVVKLGSALVYVMYPVLLGVYVRRIYRIDTHVAPDNRSIAQRWDAFWHQVAVFVMNNTDIMVLTVFTNMLEVSVYSIYNLVLHGLKRVITSFTGGLEAAFGNMIAKGEQQALRENLSVVEMIMYGLCTIVYTCTAVLILDFVRVYTKGVDDVEYLRPLFAYLIVLAHFFNGVRLPYQLVVQAAGHYKQTKKGAIVEPIMNLVLSVIFVFKFGLVGVAVGTVAATVFRTVQYSMYMCRRIVVRSPWVTVGKLLVAAGESAVTMLIVRALRLPVPTNYLGWALNALATGAVCCAVVLAGGLVFFRGDLVRLRGKLKHIIRR